MKEEIYSLIEFMSMSSKSAATSPAEYEFTIEKCIDMLETIPDIVDMSEIYNYFMNTFLKKYMRQIFLRVPTNKAKKSWLEFNYDMYLKKSG